MYFLTFLSLPPSLPLYKDMWIRKTLKVCDMRHPWQICVPVFLCELQSYFLILINLLLIDMTDNNIYIYIYIYFFFFGSCWFQYWWWSLAYIQVTKGVQCPRKITTFVSVSALLWNIISVYQMQNTQSALSYQRVLHWVAYTLGRENCHDRC